GATAVGEDDGATPDVVTSAGSGALGTTGGELGSDNGSRAGADSSGTGVPPADALVENLVGAGLELSSPFAQSGPDPSHAGVGARGPSVADELNRASNKDHALNLASFEHRVWL